MQETVESKTKFEQHWHDFGILPQSYLSDNGSSFTSAQVTQLAGVGAHHDNGVAERSIQNMMSIARTMMLHAAIHWSEVANAQLWPFAVQNAALLYNQMPNKSTGLSPHDIFMKTRWHHSKFQDFHVWGCPVYVLDKTITDGKKLPHWDSQSKQQVFVGISMPQLFPWFSILRPVPSLPSTTLCLMTGLQLSPPILTSCPTLVPPEWDKVFGDSTYQYIFDDDAPDNGPLTFLFYW